MRWETVDYDTANTEFDFMGNKNTVMFPYTSPGIVWKDKDSKKHQKPWPIRILLHRGNLQLENLSFDTNRFVTPEADILIINGDLTINGDLVVDQSDVGTPGYLIVKGNLSVRNIYVQAMFNLLVWGKITANGVIYGYDSSGGGVTCLNQLDAPIIVMERFPLKCHQLVAPLLVSDIFRGPAKVIEKGKNRIIQVESSGGYWLLRLPENVDQDEFNTDEDALAYVVLTSDALNSEGFKRTEGYGGDLMWDFLREHGVKVFRPEILQP